MKPVRRDTTRALVEPHNMEPPRPDTKKRADIPLTNGAMGMVSNQDITNTFTGDGPGSMRISEVVLHKTDQRDHKGGIIYVHEAIHEWVKDKVCTGCRLTLGVHFIQVYMGGNAVLDRILGDTDNYRHYHADCEPIDPAYKLMVSEKAIQRTVVGTDPGTTPVSQMF